MIKPQNSDHEMMSDHYIEELNNERTNNNGRNAPGELSDKCRIHRIDSSPPSIQPINCWSIYVSGTVMAQIMSMTDTENTRTWTHRLKKCWRKIQLQ